MKHAFKKWGIEVFIGEEYLKWFFFYRHFPLKVVEFQDWGKRCVYVDHVSCPSYTRPMITIAILYYVHSLHHDSVVWFDSYFLDIQMFVSAKFLNLTLFIPPPLLILLFPPSVLLHVAWLAV